MKRSNKSKEEWQVFQERVADRFRRIPICTVTEGEIINGARGKVEIDVVARFGSPFHGIVFTVLIECKYWKTKVTQEKIFALKAIVEDVGAHLGILVSEFGHQKGIKEYLDSPINIMALTFDELENLTITKLEDLVFGSRKMHSGICSDCGTRTNSPFIISEGRCLLCSDCYRKYTQFLPEGGIPISNSLIDSVGFDLIASDLGKSIKTALQFALTGHAIYANGIDPLFIFRQSLAASIREIETHPLGILFQEFLKKGPYFDIGEIPVELEGQHLTDADTALIITFIYAHMVNCFKGAIAELLAAKPCMELMRRLQSNNELPKNTRLFIGDSVKVHAKKGKQLSKGADLYFILEELFKDSLTIISILGVVEVKSYNCSEKQIKKQLNRHLESVKRGLRISNVDYPSDQVNIGYEKDPYVLQISVLPSSWKLSRSFQFVDSEGGRLLKVGKDIPLRKYDESIQTGENEWRITLEWSNEALAEAAYEMTFWYMEKIGEVIYTKTVPKGWEGMTQAEAGRNAVKMMLYYAILRCRNKLEEQRAIALYNCYSYGYALGMNFKNKEGKRKMLWPEDLVEILAFGKTKSGCIIV